MKKNLLQSVKSFMFIAIFCFASSSKGQMNFSLTPNSSTICAGNASNPVTNVISCALTSTVPGASYYTFTITSGISIFNISWTGTASTLGSTCNISTWCSAPGIYTITGIAYASNSSSVVISSVTNTILAVAGPTISVAGPSTVCPNSINTYTASGASTYTWFGSTGSGSYSINGGAVASMTAGALASFSVRGTGSNGCSNANIFSPSLGSTTVTISNNTVCAGSTATLSASGALSYNWSNGSSAASIVVSPTATTVYTLISTNPGCTMTSTHVIAVTGVPILSVLSATTICSGTSLNIIASGANTYTWLPGNIMGNAIVVSPNAATCYTVIGSNGGNCNATAISCVSVIPSPTVNLVSSGSVCAGSSITFTASGANTYTWSTIINNGSTLSVIPSISGIYSVAAQSTLNNCIRIATIAAVVSPSCAMVWPGDANRDGMVSNLDVLELGLAASSTGAARSTTSNAWAGQYANAWSGTVSTGWNKAHADCNGDGVVNSNDNTAITTNFALTHSFKSNSTSANPDISIVPQQNLAYEAIWNKADIILGDPSNTITQLYGVAFDINYDQSKIQTDSVKIIYAASFLNANNQNIDFSKAIFANGKLYCASVRVDHSNINGTGKIAEFWYKVKTGLPANSSIVISAGNAQKVNANGAFNGLSNDAGTTVNISSNLTALKGINQINSNILLYPNPANNSLILVNESSVLTSFNIIDISGRVIVSGNFTANKTIDISALTNGVYFIAFENANGKAVKKLVKE